MIFSRGTTRCIATSHASPRRQASQRRQLSGQSSALQRARHIYISRASTSEPALRPELSSTPSHTPSAAALRCSLAAAQQPSAFVLQPLALPLVFRHSTRPATALWTGRSVAASGCRPAPRAPALRSLRPDRGGRRGGGVARRRRHRPFRGGRGRSPISCGSGLAGELHWQR